ncbi:hypothetical protein GCM10023185_15490 [Hymenobacter saemangeumensis]|uniref:DUF4149 domain-containing protein n=1 Tax=Hymenobacter saemangeumensis TaxID=1084522 RepID=A0ABP8I9C0_9BACT
MKTLLFSILALLGVVVGVALLYDKWATGSTERVRNRLQCLVTQRGKAAGLFLFLVLWYAFPDVAEVASSDGQRPVLMDIGVFQTLLLATIRGLILYSFCKLFLKHEFTVIHRFLTRGSRFVRNFYQLTPWQKHLLTAVYLLGFLLLFSQLTR